MADIEKELMAPYFLGKDNRIREFLNAYLKAFENYTYNAFKKGLTSGSVLRSLSTNKHGDSAILTYDTFQNHYLYSHSEFN